MKSPIRVTSPKSLGSALRAFRKEKGLNQTEAGKPTGVDQTIVSKIERGGPVRLDTLFRLLAALDLELVVQKRQEPPSGEW